MKSIEGIPRPLGTLMLYIKLSLCTLTFEFSHVSSGILDLYFLQVKNHRFQVTLHLSYVLQPAIWGWLDKRIWERSFPQRLRWHFAKMTVFTMLQFRAVRGNPFQNSSIMLKIPEAINTACIFIFMTWQGCELRHTIFAQGYRESWLATRQMSGVWHDVLLLLLVRCRMVHREHLYFHSL